jgi:hypothetical protein
MRKIQGVVFAAALSLMFGACGGAGTAAVRGASGENVGAALTSIFSSQDQGALMMKQSIPYQLVSLMVSEAKATTIAAGPTSCDVSNTPSDVVMDLAVASGIYGVPTTGSDTCDVADENCVTLTESDGCESGGTYAAFTVATHEMT